MSNKLNPNDKMTKHKKYVQYLQLKFTILILVQIRREKNLFYALSKIYLTIFVAE